MNRHVIVPYDGILENRAAIAPAADLAWRCGAKLVAVSTTDIDDEVVQALLKSQAIAKSGADADFWVDPGLEIGAALLEAARHRSDPVICLATRHRASGVLRKKTSTTPLPVDVLRHAECPILVIGPEVDVSRGLPFTALYVPVDDSFDSRRGALLAAEWARTFRVSVHLLAMVSPGAGESGPSPVVAALHQMVAERAPGIRLDLVETARPAAALAAIAGEDPDGVVMLGSAGGDEREPLGAFAAEVVATSRRAVVFAPPAG